MGREDTEGVVAIEDGVGFFVHAFGAQEEGEWRTRLDCVVGGEIDNLGRFKEDGEDFGAEFGGESEEVEAGGGMEDDKRARGGFRGHWIQWSLD